MYRIAIVRKGQPTERRICDGPGPIRDAVWETVQAEGSTITDADHAGLMDMCGTARDMADVEGFAALEIGSAAVTIRPYSPS